MPYVYIICIKGVYLYNKTNNMKNLQLITCSKTSTIFGTLEGRVAILKRNFFYNGESYIKAMWQDSKEFF